MAADIVIHNGLLLTMAPDLAVIENGAVLIRDSIISKVGKTEAFDLGQANMQIDARGGIIMPGLVNCHTHMPMSMFRGMADDLPLDVWLNERIFPAEAKHINPGSVGKWSLHSCKEMLLAGTTTCCDGYFFEAAAVGAMVESGIRAVAGQGVIDFPAPGVPDPGQNIRAAQEFVNRIKNLSDRITPSIFCHSPYTCSKKTLVAAKQAAEDAGILFQIHVAETKKEAQMIKGLKNRSVISYLADLGLLNEKTLLVHSVWITDADIEIIQKRAARVAHCPESNMKLASGIAPVPRMVDAGIAVGLGTDGCASNNDHDLFSEMDMAAKLHKVACMDPCVMDARTCLKMATIEGARAIGLDRKIGSIERGKKADIIIVDVNKPHMVPMYDPFSSLVYSAKSSDVSWVMVDGIVRVRDGNLV
ncbi:MAG: amidohydrolase [Proteobacteria bacterium]|nr:amidohydrolase [Desulfobacula sp.]MBU4131937.1 amidohydrolase [Pseudomonadota bacterium]